MNSLECVKFHVSEISRSSHVQLGTIPVDRVVILVQYSTIKYHTVQYRFLQYRQIVRTSGFFSVMKVQ